VVAQFLQLLKADSPRNWTYTTPLKAWYGLKDEGLAPDLVAPEMALKGGPNVTLVPVVDASHRQTFINALLSSPDQPAGSRENFLDWFSTFRKESVASPSLLFSENSLKVVSDDFGLLPVRLEAKVQEGERPLHVQILRTRRDGTSEVVGALGGTSANANQLQSLGSKRVLLQVGDQLSFKLLSRSGDGFDASTTEIRPGAPGGGFDVTLRDGEGAKAPVFSLPSLRRRRSSPPAPAIASLLPRAESATDCSSCGRERSSACKSPQTVLSRTVLALSESMPIPSPVCRSVPSAARPLPLVVLSSASRSIASWILASKSPRGEE
jgi:hypothetical protein